jgi:hypothetical protein
MSWLNTPVDEVNPTKVDPAGFCCDYDLWPTKILAGYRIDTPANFNYTSVWIKDWAINSTALWDNSTEIGVGLAPGVGVFEYERCDVMLLTHDVSVCSKLLVRID